MIKIVRGMRGEDDTLVLFQESEVDHRLPLYIEFISGIFKCDTKLCADYPCSCSL
jgi:hypothetical protein